MSSILTNQSAIVALQTLKSVNSNLGKAQSEISTGKSIASAKDNAAVWAISKTMETDQSAFKTIQSNLNVASAVVSTALTGAEQVGDQLQAIKRLAVTASNTATSSERDKIADEITLRFKQVASIISGTQMNGVNLLNGASTTATATDPDTGTTTTTTTTTGSTLSVLASLDRGTGTTTTANTITVGNLALATPLTGLNVDPTNAQFGTFSANGLWRGAATDLVQGTATVGTTAGTGVQGFIERIETALSSVLAKTAELGSFAQRIQDQSTFVGKLGDSLKLGIGALVDADMEEASARLQALQTQQQLGIQSLSIANQAPSAILSLFR